MTEVQMVTQTCKKCDIEILEGHAYELGDDRWHIHCFKCFKCEKSLGCNSNFLVLGNGSLVCSQCSYSCKQCHKKIDDLAILTGDQAYCSSCFKCRVCKSKIEDLRYARTSKGLFCMACHEGLIEKKKKHDMKRRQMAQLSSSSRPSPQDELEAPFGDGYAQRNVSSHSMKQLPSVQPELAAGSPLAAPSVAAQGSLAAPAPKSFAAPSAASPDDRSFGTALSTTTTQISAPFSDESAQIEEINDSDDELKIRRMREKLDRRFRKSSTQADGAIIELIDSFSAPNTPSTIYNAADELSLGSKEERRFFDSDADRSTWKDAKDAFKDASKDAKDASKDDLRDVSGGTDSRKNRTQTTPRNLEPTSPHKNLLLLSPNQFHDNDFHVTGNNLSNRLSAEEYRPRSSASSPMAKANRQARVVETNDVSATEIPADLGHDDGSASRTPQSRDWSRPDLTPKKAASDLKVTSPPPRSALPQVPSTPPPPDTEDSLPTGLGLDMDMRSQTSSWSQPAGEPAGPVGGFRRTPAVTNLEETIPAEAPSRKQSVRSKMTLKHKRSVSGGQNSLSSKFGLFKNKDDGERGHSRTASEGSVAGTAYKTAPLPLSSPMRSTPREHARSTSDTHFGEMPADFEMRSIKFELGQLDMRRQSLLAETARLAAEKNKLLESLRAVQKKHASEQQHHDALMVQVNHLAGERARLMDENARLKQDVAGSGSSRSSSNTGSNPSAAASPPHSVGLSAGSTGGSRSSQLLDEMYDGSAGLDSVAEEGSEARATRLRFWRRPKVTLGAAGTAGTAAAAAPVKMSSSASQQQLSTHLAAPEESGARKALNFMSKSRSTYVLDHLADAEPALLTSTLQARAQYENEPVPLIITRCLAEVEARGFDVEGIYRLSGGNSAISAIENAFAAVTSAPDRKQSARLSDVLGGDINAVTSALKRYLRKLPDPIIPFAVYDNFIRIGHTKQEWGKDGRGRVDELCADFSACILDRLPSANKHALYMICKHLDQVNYYSSVNRMTFKNLSVVFAPTISRDVTGEREMADMAARNEATELLLCNFRRIFQNYSPGA